MKYKIETDLKFLATPVPDFNFTIPPTDPLQLGKDLLELLYEHRGLGLAANQCMLPYRCFVMIGSPEDYVCFNPTIVYMSEEKTTSIEGCLSFPGLVLDIPRSKEIRIRFTAPNGERVTTKFQGLTARIAIHETMHLNGKLFFEDVSKLKMRMAIKKAQKRGFDYSKVGLLSHCSWL